MRKTITTLFAAAALAATAQTAAADTSATYSTNDYGTGIMQSCTTQHQEGVQGAYGAWGHYIDGCTVRLTCPTQVQVCEASEDSRIRHQRETRRYPAQACLPSRRTRAAV